jgi:hypothetical protein
VLKWTYVVGYFADKNMTKQEINLFKYQQMALEEACELMHQLLEKDLSPFLDTSIVDRSPFYKFKADVTNKMEILRNSYRSFVEHVQMLQ